MLVLEKGQSVRAPHTQLLTARRVAGAKIAPRGQLSGAPRESVFTLTWARALAI